MKIGDMALVEVGYRNEWVIVRIMAFAEGWAMVRRKGAMPFCVMTKELRPAQVAGPAHPTAPGDERRESEK